MIAAFLRKFDGDFDYATACASFLFTLFSCFIVWTLYSALKTGRMPYPVSTGYKAVRVCWLEWKKKPVVKGSVLKGVVKGSVLEK